MPVSAGTAAGALAAPWLPGSAGAVAINEGGCSRDFIWTRPYGVRVTQCKPGPVRTASRELLLFLGRIGLLCPSSIP